MCAHAPQAQPCGGRVRARLLRVRAPSLPLLLGAVFALLFLLFLLGAVLLLLLLLLLFLLGGARILLVVLLLLLLAPSQSPLGWGFLFPPGTAPSAASTPCLSSGCGAVNAALATSSAMQSHTGCIAADAAKCHGCSRRRQSTWRSTWRPTAGHEARVHMACAVPE